MRVWIDLPLAWRGEMLFPYSGLRRRGAGRTRTGIDGRSGWGSAGGGGGSSGRPSWLHGGDLEANSNMVDRNLLREFDVSDDEITALVVAADGSDSLDHFLGAGQSFEIGRIVSGKVVEVVGDQVVV